MLEIRYRKANKEVTGWCGDPAQFGLLKERDGEAVIIIPVALPDQLCDAYLYNETTELLELRPDWVTPSGLSPELQKMWDEIDKIWQTIGSRPLSP